ncbi:MAG: histidinol dehydrogenase [Candidatus Methylomirabilis oxygeniifera]|uniref:Histidinol dehydrogenase n=1 Tax=Methylomirabilis oxygeniifera TaxID=671143 RepID=D5MI02_METO1|nr:MAG: histidinol dehydrogenase [Candidatus Methylomirabilis oxyfera]CBE69295.1 histidinol dehydrogenase (HDH) [Candidatus Methylomirabilis oxyfera]
MKLLQAGSQEWRLFVAQLRSRQGALPAEVERTVRGILDAIRTGGDSALFEQTERFDGVRLDAASVQVKSGEVEAAYVALPPASLEAIKTAVSRVRAFHLRQLRPSWFSEEDGAIVGMVVRPLDRVGIYVPGGTAAYPSTVLMNAIPAAIAGVAEVVMCTPPRRDGKVADAVLVAADLCGVHTIYKAGGVQAVAAMAYGTASIPRVDKIVGPGNVYVAAAKRLVFGQVGIDMIAGPTELLIIADEEADAAWVAADLLSQAEHDPLSSAMLLTPSQRLAGEVVNEVTRQVALLPRRQIAEASLEQFGAAVVVKGLGEAATLCNEIAPEHLELLVKDPWGLLPQIRHAGAIFMGGASPEVVGDYLAGPNHILPTGGTARFASPLSVADFQRQSSLIAFSRQKLEALEPTLVELARLEGLEAHARAASIRRLS